MLKIIDNTRGKNTEIPTKDNIVGRAETYDSFNSLVNSKKDELFKTAESLVMNYHAQHDIENVSREYNDRGYVFCRVRLRETSDSKSIEISWYKMNVHMSGNTPVKLSKHIKKGTSTIYPMSRFVKHAKEWELEMIEESEKHFQLIRKSLLSLKRVMQGVKLFCSNDQKSVNLLENN